jgi:cysteine synthase
MDFERQTDNQRKRRTPDNTETHSNSDAVDALIGENISHILASVQTSWTIYTTAQWLRCSREFTGESKT